MKVIPTDKSIEGVPDYYNIYLLWYNEYLKTRDPKVKTMATHYALVAEEMGQVTIIDDATSEVILYAT